MKAQHTPGPWVVDGQAIAAKDNDHLCIGGAWPFGFDAETVEANARLIAAAPEILQALQEIVGSADAGNAAVNMPLLDQARAAIAKATGGEV